MAYFKGRYKRKRKEDFTGGVKEFRKGDYIRFLKKDGTMENRIWVRGDYIPSEKKYSVYAFDDINKERFVSGSKKATNDFIF